MGVKDLWNILSPLSEKKPLHELQGKVVAIDLSCWVVDSQNVADNAIQPKMYLRNLYFRTSYLLLHNIFPIFVLEGNAPTLKHNTIAKRNENRKGAVERKTAKKGGRTQFNRILNECQEMLNCMGLTCVKGQGEAEATCAYLNADGLVDGCISQDSDCFLYGAKVVYRNFTTSGKTGAAGSVDEYKMEKIEKTLQIGRNKMIALALLCGCDYDDGVNGVGKEAALKFFKIIDDDEVLNRMKNWKVDPKFQRMENELNNPDICTNCGHRGKLRSHIKLGCVDCGTSVKCNDAYKEKRLIIMNEISIRKKTLEIDKFPNQELIDEFLVRKGLTLTKLDLQWRKPEVVKFICFVEKKLQWEPSYAFAKIFPLMTRWQLLNLKLLPVDKRMSVPGVFIPDKIKKKRCLRSVPSYEILWIDKYNILEGRSLEPVSDKENGTNDDVAAESSPLMSIEPQESVLECYPMIVNDFEELINSKNKKKTTRTRKKKNNDTNTESDDNLKTQKVSTRRRKKKLEPLKENRNILEFITTEKNLHDLEKSLQDMAITPKRSKKSTPIKVSKKYDESKSDSDFEMDDFKALPTETIEKRKEYSCKKKGPQFNKVLNTERLDSILNGSIAIMFNELTDEDFPSDGENIEDMSIIIEKICTKNVKKETEIFEEEDILPKRCASDCENNDSIDKFDFDETYVPLTERLQNSKKGKSRRTSTPERISIGINSLLNSSTPCNSP